MMRNSVFAVLISFILVASCTPAQDRYVEIKGYAQGGNYSVKINLKGVNVPPEEIRDSVESFLEMIDTTLSGYNKKSILSRFNAGQKVPASRVFMDIYRRGYRLWERSGGALDFGAAPLYDAWGFGFRNSSFPTDREIAELLKTSGMDNLPAELPVTEDGFIDPAAIGFPKLNFNAIAQGYTCDVIADYLYRIGIKDMLVDIGEIWCDGLNPNGKPWSIGVDRPVDRDSTNENDTVSLEGIWSSDGQRAGIVTSGNYRKYYIKDGRKYAHTIDPMTGYPVSHNLLSATVVSKDNAADADAIATWCMVVGLQSAQVLILGDPSLEGYLIYNDDRGQMMEWASPGFNVRN